jgi:O-antigen/teichoic acid export membrane protein
MSRLKNFSRNLATSYLQLGVNVIYSLVSVPLILHWLPKAEFGMWAVLVQLMSYMSLMDFGMTAAIARLLVDHKDERSNANYGSLVKTAFFVSLAQGLIILTVVWLGSPILTSLMNIPAEYEHTFTLLMRLQGLIVAFNFCLRPLGMMLYAHQRMDLQYYNDMFSLSAQLGLLVLFLMKGTGIFSFVYANAITAVISPFYFYWNCRRLNFLPKGAEWGGVSRKLFKEVFWFGKDMFLMGLGSQLGMASQTIVITRGFGLEQAAAWSVGSKSFNLLIPLMGRALVAALPGLYEICARGEKEKLQARFREVVVLVASLGALFGVSLAMCNNLFVHFWSRGKIPWSPWNDLLLGIWIFILSMTTTHISLVNVTKQIGGMRYILIVEGVCFVSLALVLIPVWGIPGMIMASIITTLLFTYQYSLRRSAGYFQCGFLELALGWVQPSLKQLLVLGTGGLVLWLATGSVPAFWRLLIHAIFVITVGGLLLIKLGIPSRIMEKIAARFGQVNWRLKFGGRIV